MSLAYFSPLANHLWQSTLFAVIAWLLTLALRKNRAAVRYWIWLAASIKFLIPFSLLIDAGSQLAWRTAPAVEQRRVSFVVDAIGRPFVSSDPGISLAGATPPPSGLPGILLLSVWLLGVAVGVIWWLRRWLHIRATQRTATLLDLNLPIPVLSSSAKIEPGVFGIRKPVLLLPEGIAERLTPDQLEAVLAHELCHFRRRDNLTGAIHMLVETIFWFHPLVWWIRTRLIEERERACDDDVLNVVSDARVYAEGILNVCKFYLESPLVCVSGVTGSRHLKRRIEEIMAQSDRAKYGFRKQEAFDNRRGYGRVGGAYHHRNDECVSTSSPIAADNSSFRGGVRETIPGRWQGFAGPGVPSGWKIYFEGSSRDGDRDRV